ncbi:MAG: YddF family protein [Acaryochloris sp. RU_4_1]|nr:YddF family protein [Acaryochloris sp. RU_4_1]NJR55419.1 YddF family protein [Acaryochloris sp. CRU_2_0]
MLLGILNTSIVTAYGSYEYKPVSLEEAQKLVQEFEILSAVGHESTSQILSELLQAEVPVNRIQFAQEVGQIAIVFKLKGRPPEGKILSREEIDAIGYDFGLLSRKS